MHIIKENIEFTVLYIYIYRERERERESKEIWLAMEIPCIRESISGAKVGISGVSEGYPGSRGDIRG